VSLRLSAREFWRSRPRLIVAMLDQVRQIEIGKMKMLAHLIWGGKLDEDEQGSATYDPTD